MLPDQSRRDLLIDIAVITVCFNAASTLETAIRSVQGQSYPNVHHYIVDGASTDGTVELLERHANSTLTHRIHYRSQKDRGLYDAMNRGIEWVRTELPNAIVGFLNADDFLADANVLERVAEAFCDKNLDAVYGDVCFVQPENLARATRFSSGRVFQPCLVRAGLMPPHPSFYARLSLYNQVGEFNLNYRIAADFDWMLRAFALNHTKARYLKKIFTVMRQGGLSTQGLKSHRTIWREHREIFQNHRIFSPAPIRATRYVYKLLELGWTRIFPPTVPTDFSTNFP